MSKKIQQLETHNNKGICHNHGHVPRSFKFKNPFNQNSSSRRVGKFKSNGPSRAFGPKLSLSKMSQKKVHEEEPAVYASVFLDSRTSCEKKKENSLSIKNQNKSLRKVSSNGCLETRLRSSRSNSPTIQQESQEPSKKKGSNAEHKGSEEMAGINGDLKSNLTRELYLDVINKLRKEKIVSRRKLRDICLGNKNNENFAQYYVYRKIEQFLCE